MSPLWRHKVYKGRSRLIDTSYRDAPALIGHLAPVTSLHLFAGANPTKQFTAGSKYDVVFSLRGHPPALSTSNSFAAPAGMFLRTLLADFSASFIGPRHPNLPTSLQQIQQGGLHQ